MKCAEPCRTKPTMKAVGYNKPCDLCRVSGLVHDFTEDSLNNAKVVLLLCHTVLDSNYHFNLHSMVRGSLEIKIQKSHESHGTIMQAQQEYKRLPTYSLKDIFVIGNNQFHGFCTIVLLLPPECIVFPRTIRMHAFQIITKS